MPVINRSFIQIFLGNQINPHFLLYFAAKAWWIQFKNPAYETTPFVEILTKILEMAGLCFGMDDKNL